MTAVAACSQGDGQEDVGNSKDAVLQTVFAAPFGFNGAWEDTGAYVPGTGPGGTVPAPALVAESVGKLDLFYRFDDALMQRMWSASGWAPPKGAYSLTTGLASDPSASASSSNDVSVVWRNGANAVTHYHFDGSTWVNEPLGGTIDGKPTITTASDGSRRDVFARVGTSLWHKGWVPATGWGVWESLGLTIDSDPVAASPGPGKIGILYRANDGTTRGYGWDGSWPSWHVLPIGAGPSARLATAIWKPYASLGGWARGAPALVAYGTTLQAFVQGGNDVIYANESNAIGWTGWHPLTGCTLGTPAAASWSTGAFDPRVDLIAMDMGLGELYHDVEQSFPSASVGPRPACCGNNAEPVCIAPSESRWGAPCAHGLGAIPGDGICTSCGSPTVSATAQGTSAVLVHVQNASAAKNQVTLTSESDPNDTVSNVVSAGNPDVSFYNLTQATTYDISVTPNLEGSGCGAVTTTVDTALGKFSKSLHGQVGDVEFWATVNVDGDRSTAGWTTTFHDHGTFYGDSYTLDVFIPGADGSQKVLETIGTIGLGATTNPPQSPVTDPWFATHFKEDIGGTFGWHLSTRPPDNQPRGGDTTIVTCSGAKAILGQAQDFNVYLRDANHCVAAVAKYANSASEAEGCVKQTSGVAVLGTAAPQQYWFGGTDGCYPGTYDGDGIKCACFAHGVDDYSLGDAQTCVANTWRGSLETPLAGDSCP